MKILQLLLIPAAILLVTCCGITPKKKSSENLAPQVHADILTIDLSQDTTSVFNLKITTTGRYKLTVFGKATTDHTLWIEDYLGNKDNRTYDITGKLILNKDGVTSADGSPLAKGIHLMRVHADSSISIDSVQFKLLFAHKETPTSLTQKMDGDKWHLVWSDEFDGEGLPDTTKWTYNVGNWGWGNNEPQYYTKGRIENARQQDGNLIIEAKKNDLGFPWTSARLSTQGKTSFLYGKIEFRAKVPVGRGTWAAGWLLGDDYKDELSWPYCGEIDVLECVGYEINDTTGRGINHATCHTKAYYFKQNNQIGSKIEVDSMNTKFHTYAVEWYPNEIKGFVDGEHYYTYDKTADELEWPFYKAQNIIINLAVGGGWGGAKGIDESYESHQYVLDYLRVYEKK